MKIIEPSVEDGMTHLSLFSGIGWTDLNASETR